jgi:hypothetical protein
MQPVDAQGVQNAGQNLGAVGTSAGVGGDSTSVSTLVGTFINVALSMVGIIFLGLMVYAGILWMTARGEEEQVKKAQKIIYACIIGLFITVSAYAITAFITSRPEFGGSGQ